MTLKDAAGGTLKAPANSVYASAVATGYARRNRSLPAGKVLVSDRNLSLRATICATGSHTHHHTKTVRTACTDVQFRFPHYNASANLEARAAALLTFRASVSINGGTNQELTVNGANDVTIGTAGGYVDSDPLAVELKPGDTVRTNVYVIAGQPYSLTNSADTSYGDSYTLSADATGPATAVGSGFGVGIYGPSLIFGTPQPGTTSKPVVGILGDSVARGWGDLSLYGGDGGGYLVRALNRDSFPWVNIARPTATAVDWSTQYGRKIRVGSVADVDYGILLIGANDLNSLGASAATVQAAQIARAREVFVSRGIPTWICTTSPIASSTDSWATTGNQTTVTSNTARNTVNTWIRAGCPVDNATSLTAVAVGTTGALLAGQTGHPFAGIIDAISAVETAAGSGVFKAPGYTTDGLHPTTVGHTAMAALVSTSQFVAR